MSDNNVKDLPLGNETMQRLVVAAIEKYVAAMTPPTDQAEKQLWDQVVMSKMHAHGITIGPDGQPVAVIGSPKDAVEMANGIITERRKFFAGRSGDQN